jgi:hypothetical protein
MKQMEARKMNKREFRNLLCLLHSIDSWELPAEWSPDAQSAFLRDSVDFFLRSDDVRSDAIWRAMMIRINKSYPRVEMDDNIPS